MLSMYFAEFGSTGAREMSLLSALLAGKIGHEPSRGAGAERPIARADAPAASATHATASTPLVRDGLTMAML